MRCNDLYWDILTENNWFIPFILWCEIDGFKINSRQGKRLKTACYVTSLQLTFELATEAASPTFSCCGNCINCILFAEDTFYYLSRRNQHLVSSIDWSRLGYMCVAWRTPFRRFRNFGIFRRCPRVGKHNLPCKLSCGSTPFFPSASNLYFNVIRNYL